MIELVALWFLTRRLTQMADERRRDRAWSFGAVAAWFFFEWAGIKIGLALDLGWFAYAPAVLLGAAAGFAVFATLRSLPALPPFDPRTYDETWTEETCPRCGSEQTYLGGARLRCYRCNYFGRPTEGPPKVGVRTVRSYP